MMWVTSRQQLAIDELGWATRMRIEQLRSTSDMEAGYHQEASLRRCRIKMDSGVDCLETGR